jgi:hypothetical protein
MIYFIEFFNEAVEAEIMAWHGLPVFEQVSLGLSSV